jgi:hypothetical protein
MTRRTSDFVLVFGTLLLVTSCDRQLPAAAAASPQPAARSPEQPAPAPDGFKGIIKLDIRDSVADWTPYTPKRAPEGAPNFLFILYDDTGLAAWSPYGGRRPEQRFVSKAAITPGKHTVGVEFTRENRGDHGESLGTARLYLDDKVVAEGPMRTQAGKFTLSGDGLCVGYDSGDAVSQEYKTPGTFRGGKIECAGVTVEKAQYLDLEQEARRVMMAQ